MFGHLQEASTILSNISNNTGSTSVIFDTDQKLNSEQIKTLINGLKNNQTVTSLTFKWQRFDDEEINNFANALLSNKTLTQLCFVLCDISTKGAEILGNMLKNNKNLLSFSIACNKFGYEGRKAIIEALNEDISLIHFEVGGATHFDNKMTDKDASIIAQMLKVNKTLRSLKIRSDNISENGAVLIKNALEDNKTLTRMKWSGAYFTQIIAEPLQNNTITLSSLYLRNTTIFSKNLILAKALEKI